MKEAIEDLFAFLFEQAVQALDGVDKEAAVVGRSARVVFAQN